MLIISKKNLFLGKALLMKFIKTILFFFTAASFYAQNQNYAVATIPAALTENANAVIREKVLTIEISSIKSMTISTKRVVTVLNEKGLEDLNAAEYYSNSSKIKSMEATILNKDGQEIKKIKRRDFKESSVSEGAIITDNKLVYLDYTPVIYPFTLVYESVVETSNTAFIPKWYAVESAYVSVEFTKLSIDYISNLGFKYKEFNFDASSAIQKVETATNLTYTATNIPAYKYEAYSPAFQNFAPYVMFGLTSFNLEGVEGVASDWKNFGSWMYESLLKSTEEIPQPTKDKILQLIGTEKDPLKITKIIYQYVQDKTRYVSIQLGIGGWKPMLAKDVDRLGYGDCKALTNYTRSLLKVAGVPSYYTVIYGDTDIRNLQQDFVSMQGNHVILGVPTDKEMLWLECTSQTTPFGFQGDFTDNRYALVIKPEGGEIIKTHEFKTEENTQLSNGNFTIDATGNFSGSVVIKSKGTQYDNKFGNELKSQDDRIKFYKNYFWYINNLNLKDISFANNKNEVEFQESLAFQASGYANVVSGQMMFAINAFNQSNNVPQRYRTRKNPFEIERGFYDYDEITINLPSEFTLEAKPDNFELKDKFGYYKIELVSLNDNQLLYKRTYQLNPGLYSENEYESFRKFKETIAKMDNAKIIMNKKQ